MTLSPEIISAIISVLGTTFIGYILFQIKIHRGNKVLFRKLQETSLINISNLVSSDMSFTYKDKPVGKLKLYEFELTNEGYIDIENLELTIEIIAKEKTGLLEVIVDDNLNKTIVENISNGEYYYLIKRPFLNMKSANKKEKIPFQIFSDSELEISISGGGKGWGVVYKEKRREIPLLIITMSTIFIGLIGFILSFFAVIKNRLYAENSLFIETSITFVLILLVILAITENFIKHK